MAGSSEEGFDVTALWAFLIVELPDYYIRIGQMCKGAEGAWIAEGSGFPISLLATSILQLQARFKYENRLRGVLTILE